MIMKNEIATVSFGALAMTLVVCFLLFSRGVSYAAGIDENAGIAGAQFLKISTGARPLSMGESFCSVSDDVNSIFYNPSGLARMTSSQLGLTYNRWFEQINEGVVSCALRSNSGVTFALSGLYLQMDSLVGMDENRQKTDDFTASDMAGIVSLAIPAGGMFIGGNLKLIYQTIETENAFGLAGDFGLLVRLGSDFGAGFSVQNVGTKIRFIAREDPLPQNMKAGISYKLKGTENELLLSGDLNIPTDNAMYFNLGAEYGIRNMMFVRGGYNSRNDLTWGWSAGAGLRIAGYCFDYAWLPGSLGSSHRVSINIGFGGKNSSQPPANINPEKNEK